MKIKLFVTCEIQYFELGIFSFNSYVYYLTRGFIASTRAFNLLTRAFNLPTRAFSVPTCAFNLATRAFILLTRGFDLVTRNTYFTFPRSGNHKNFEQAFIPLLDKHAPFKSKKIQANQVLYMTKNLRKAIMKISELKTEYFKTTE